jgi:hypothetical protein
VLNGGIGPPFCENGGRDRRPSTADAPTIESVLHTFSKLREQLGLTNSFAPSSQGRTSTPLAFWHLASLDAPTVAITWSLAFAWAFHLHLPAWVLASLALAVWAVYIGDRLLDAQTALRTGRLHRLRDRHRFHWRHRRVFFPLALGAAVAAAAVIVALMPPISLERNSVLAAATLVYFTGVHSPLHRLPLVSGGLRAGIWARIPSAELLVGILFTSGCVLPVFSRATKAELTPLVGVALYFGLLASLNCMGIHCWESRNRHSPGAGILGHALVLSAAGLLAACWLSGPQPGAAALLTAGAASALLLALLDRLRKRLTPLTLRAFADLVLLTPLVLLAR